MKIGKFELVRRSKGTELAAGKKPNASGREQGDSGVKSGGYFDNELILGDVGTPGVKQILRMIDNDGTAAGLYNVMTFPVLATPWRIVPDEKDIIETVDKDGNKSTTHPQADFVDACLRNPQHKGGMSTPFSLVLADLMLAIAQGHRIFEIVYKLNDQGMIVFQKIVARDFGEYTILYDDTGGFNGFEQNVTKNGKTTKVHIELPYAFLFTYRKERNKLKGMSAFRAAYYHFDKKHRLYYLANQQAQQAAINPKVLTAPDKADPGDRDANLANVDKMAVRPSIALPFGWELKIHSPSKSIDLMPYIDHQNVEMARSVLAEGQMLGTLSGSKGGSYSLAESKMDMFMLGERTLIGTVEEHITAFLISKLIDYNFEKPLYPTFKFDDMSGSTQNLLTEAFKSLTSKGTIPDWISEGIAKRVAEQLEIEEPDDADTDDDDDGGDGNKNDETVDKPSSNVTENARPKKAKRLAKSEWWRELTDAEAKVQFAALQEKADAQEQALLDDLKQDINVIRDNATLRLKPLLEEKGLKALDDFKLEGSKELADTLNAHMLDIYGDAKLGAANEIKQDAPANKKASKDMIARYAKAVAEKQLADMLFEINTIVTDAVRKNKLAKSTELSVGDVIASISAMFSAFYESKEGLTASAAISLAINTGLDDVFVQYTSIIDRYQYSAILDSKVCATCKDLDGSIVDKATYFATKWMPPIHFYCRCLWVAILNDEENKPDYTGLPDAPGGDTEPTLSYTYNGDEYAVWLANESADLWAKRKAYGKK